MNKQVEQAHKRTEATQNHDSTQVKPTEVTPAKVGAKAATSPSRKPLYLMLTAVIVIVAVLIFVLFNYDDKTSANKSAASNPTTTSSTDAKAKQQNSSPESESGSASEADFPLASPRNENATEIIKSITRARPDDPMARGNLNAPVTMLQFEDYSCPMCTRFEIDVAPALEKYVEDGTLRIEFHHLPIFSDRYNSNLAAEGAYAAGDQGKFWEYNHALYNYGAKQAKSTGDGHVTWDKALLKKLAGEIGLDVNRFEQDLEKGNLRQRLIADYQKVANLFQGTPAFLINDRYIAGADRVERFEDTIKAAKHTK